MKRGDIAIGVILLAAAMAWWFALGCWVAALYRIGGESPRTPTQTQTNTR